MGSGQLVRLALLGQQSLGEIEPLLGRGQVGLKGLDAVLHFMDFEADILTQHVAAPSQSAGQRSGERTEDPYRAPDHHADNGQRTKAGGDNEADRRLEVGGGGLNANLLRRAGAARLSKGPGMGRATYARARGNVSPRNG